MHYRLPLMHFKFLPVKKKDWKAVKLAANLRAAFHLQALAHRGMWQ